MAAPIRVLCIDDHRMVREGLVEILDKQADIEVVASGDTGEAAVRLYETFHPDVTLMDLQMPVMSGLEAIRRIHARDTHARIVVLTMYQGDEDIHRALAAGATTYVLKDMVAEELLRVIRAVHAGERPMHADVKAILDRRAGQSSLTSREVEVLELIAEGRRNKDIATLLGVSDETVHAHLKNIFLKLEVSDRTAAVHVALRRGIIHIGSN
jgi:DNA-binding NarL/FixJ family response regulator